MKYHFAATAAAALAAVAPSCTSAPDAASAPDTSAAPATEAVITNIMTRTSVRRFTPRPISADTLETIVKAGMAAPTAVNKQPWEFVVVTERAVLDSIMAVHPYSNLQTATAAIIVCGNMEKTLDGEGRQYWVQDCSAASENILLAAHAFGLGAVWCGVYPMADRIGPLRSVLSLPDYITPLNVIAMGHCEGEHTPKDKWNPDAVHYQRW